MNLGQKIRTARLEMGMTQNELAGDFITRNMLSQIENGQAMPSLPTVQYLAGKLGIDCGILLSEGDNTDSYSVIRILPLMKKAFVEKDYEKCLELSEKITAKCDEKELLCAECHTAKAYTFFEKGQISTAKKEAGISQKCISACVYPCDGIETRLKSLFKMMSLVTKDGESDEIPEYYLDHYIEKSKNKSQYDMYAEAKQMVAVGNYNEAESIIRNILKREKSLDVPLVYMLYSDLEICCREKNDFESAYKYSQKAKKLYEEMTKGI